MLLLHLTHELIFSDIVLHTRMRISSIIIVLLGLLSCVYSETCPDQEDLYSCTCEENEGGDILVTCSDSSLTLLDLKTALNSLSEKVNVDLVLDDISLETLPSNFFYGIGIKRLEINGCDLDTLSDDGRSPFLGLETTLLELSIVSTFTEDNFPATLQIGHLQKLAELELSHNAITELNNDWFDRGLRNLKYLTISFNFIQKIGNKAFANLRNLKQFSLDGNRFDTIERSILPNPAVELETLILDNNALTHLPNDMFSGMPNLSSVYLRTNGIIRLEENVWKSVWQQLDVIHLEGNPIECTGHLNWIFKLRRTSAIYGTCNAPREFEGQSLQELIDSRSQLNI